MRQNFSLITLIILLFLVKANHILMAQSCYELVWSDEFNYKGLPDSTKWTYEVGGTGWGNNELQYYTNKRSENARVEDSILVIEARKEAYGGSQYTSARLITYNNDFSWKYGKIEARMKLPYGQGIWPAFWMLGDNIFEGTGWPACGEIDIMEMIGGGEGRDDVSHGTIHWADANNNHAMFGGENQISSGILADNFHVYSIEWTETQIKWFFDGIQFHVADITPSHLSEFHNNFFFILNLAVGGNWPGNPNSSTVFPQTMEVDYVRVYQQNQTPEISGKKKVIKAEKNLTYSTVESNNFIYNWNVPEDAEIVSGQGTPKLNVNWGCVAGILTCELVTLCDTYKIEYPVELDVLEITGKNIVAEYEENILYSIPELLETAYLWTLPEMVSSTTTLDTNVILLNWGAQDGTILLNVENACGTDSASYNVKVSYQLPYPNIDQPHNIPGTIESLHYDYGGEGIAYHDTEAMNLGTGSRQDEGVDTEANDGGENIGWIEAGEWLEYTVKTDSSGLLNLEMRVASQSGGGALTISFNGEKRTETIEIPSTGSWTNFTSIYIEGIQINATDSIMRVEFSKGLFNMGRMIFDYPVSIREGYASSEGITIYPSLASESIFIKDQKQPYNYTISNTSGQLMETGQVEIDAPINIKNLNEGIYIIILQNEFERHQIKFIKAQ